MSDFATGATVHIKRLLPHRSVVGIRPSNPFRQVVKIAFNFHAEQEILQQDKRCICQGAGSSGQVGHIFRCLFSTLQLRNTQGFENMENWERRPNSGLVLRGPA